MNTTVRKPPGADEDWEYAGFEEVEKAQEGRTFIIYYSFCEMGPVSIMRAYEYTNEFIDEKCRKEGTSYVYDMFGEVGILAIGRMIKCGMLDHRRVIIRVKEENDHDVIHFLEFDEDGELSDWPNPNWAWELTFRCPEPRRGETQ